MAPHALLTGGLLALVGVVFAATGCGDDGLEVRGRAPVSSAADVAQIAGCDGRGRRAPTRLDLRCRAPRQMLTDLHWRDWAAPVAHATGRLVTAGGCDAVTVTGATPVPSAGAPGVAPCDIPASVRAGQLVLGSRTGQYRALAVTSGVGGARHTTSYDIDDRGPVDQ